MAKRFKTNQSLVNEGFNQISGQTLSLSGNTLIGNSATLKYSGDQSSAYVARSIVDADYVTGLTCQAILTASNGLTKVGTNVIFGGALTGNTNITLSNNNLNIIGDILYVGFVTGSGFNDGVL